MGRSLVRARIVQARILLVLERSMEVFHVHISTTVIANRATILMHDHFHMAFTAPGTLVGVVRAQSRLRVPQEGLSTVLKHLARGLVAQSLHSNEHDQLARSSLNYEARALHLGTAACNLSSFFSRAFWSKPHALLSFSRNHFRS